MRPKRPQFRTRRRLASWLAVVLLLTHWMVAAYACAPLGAPAAVQGADTAVVTAAAAELPPCHAGAAAAADSDAGLPNLCQAHCAADAQLPGAAATADLPGPSLGWCLVALPPAVAKFARAEPAGGALRAGAPPGWPPLFLTHRVLRI